LEGEVRSLSADTALAALHEVQSGFDAAAQSAGARVELEVKHEYTGYHLAEGDPVVLRARQAFDSLASARASALVVSGGGSDANEFNARGLRSCVLGIGAEGCHTVAERVRISDIELLTRWVMRTVEGTAR
jgi:tripeptide aminopeptidase